DGRRVDDWLERRPWLTERLRGAGELRVVELTSPHQCADRAVARVHGDERTLQIGRIRRRGVVAICRTSGELLVRRVRELAVLPALDRADLILERALGGGLHVEIERRVDLESLLVQPRAEFLVELLPNP